ncbi:uncharacterized protein [Nicotiana sylvestris]|uniref:uncharacterized protein n=1 Tax=Nicotiana sylvestris TaxID=4096 RepID=UPI00388C923E
MANPAHRVRHRLCHSHRNESTGFGRYLVENPVNDEYMPLSTYFPDKEDNSIEEVVPDDNPVWKMYFDGVVNIKGVGIGAILISPIGHQYHTTAQLRFFCTNNTVEYNACIMGLKMAINLDVHELLVMYIPRFYNELADALATLASMLPYTGNTHIDPLEIQVQNQYGYYNTIDTEPDGEPWYHDIKRFLKTKEYLKYAKGDQKRTIRRLASAVTFKAITKKAVVDFVHSNIICHFGIPKTIITDNAANLNSHLMKEVCEKSKIMHHHSTPYWPKANGAIAAANKNIKKILRKMIQGSRQRHEKLPFALLGYRTTVRIYVGATLYLLVYGTEAVIPAEVKIPSLRIIVESEIEDTEWVKTRLEQLMLIDEKWLAALCFGQLY